MKFITNLIDMHNSVFRRIEQMFEGWFVGLATRLAFFSVLYFYFLNSAKTKLGDGFMGIFIPDDGAFAQILPSIYEASGYDTELISFFPWGLLVVLGTWSEFILPVLIVAGLATRLAALGMIGFITVQSFVDIVFHHLDDKSIGAMFDGAPGALIYDQRLLWILLLVILVVKGAGKISVDGLLGTKGLK
ncbi:MAG: hypothetical protein COB90_01495 [Hyphomicrobiales bacterium]|nr:MAG: hypothetical protein COB90_01495 [Hyphomicrobiales bacterium]